MARGDESRFAKFVKAFAAQIQNLENAAYDTRILRRLDVAADAQLDSIGELVGETRQGRSDINYKTAILARIQMNASCGEPERLIAAVRALTDATVITLRDIFPASVELTFLSSETYSQLYNYLQRLCPAGVQLYLIQSDSSESFTLSSSSSSESSTSYGLANSSQTTGGKLSNLLSE